MAQRGIDPQSDLRHRGNSADYSGRSRLKVVNGGLTARWAGPEHVLDVIGVTVLELAAEPLHLPMRTAEQVGD